MAIVWHQMEVHDLAAIGRMTRHQIYNILARKVDKNGRVELHYRTEGGKPSTGNVTLTDYESIARHAFRLQLEKQGMPAELIPEAIEREMAKTATAPVGEGGLSWEG